MTEIEFYKAWDLAFRNSKNKLRKCLVDGCEENAIKSHALQKNGILNQISEKNHLFQFSNVSAFQKAEKGSFELSKIGINDVYTFPGFCKEHDSSIFKQIETKKFELESDKSINLFSYRALCQEIRRKEIAIDVAQKLIETNYNVAIVVHMSNYKIGLINGLKNLYFFKKELENDLENSDGKFLHKICEIPKTELCISAPLNIYDKDNELSKTHDNYGRVLNNPFVTSFVNLFPYGDKSYLMITISKDFPCNWTENIFNKFQKLKSPNHLKLISDLITTRFEFWCISPKLRSTLSKLKIDEMIEIWSEEVLNFDSVIETNFNVFG
ncbi:MAG: hypothetical protein V4580_14230 [Bacteroidota bacterium]